MYKRKTEESSSHLKRVAHSENAEEMPLGEDYVHKIMKTMDSLHTSEQEIMSYQQRMATNINRDNSATTSTQLGPPSMSKQRRFLTERQPPLMKKCRTNLKHIKKNRSMPKPRAHIGPRPDRIPNVKQKSTFQNTLQDSDKLKATLKTKSNFKKPDENMLEANKLLLETKNPRNQNIEQEENAFAGSSSDDTDDLTDFYNYHNLTKSKFVPRRQESKKKKKSSSSKTSKVASQVLSDLSHNSRISCKRGNGSSSTVLSDNADKLTNDVPYSVEISSGDEMLNRNVSGDSSSDELVHNKNDPSAMHNDFGVHEAIADCGVGRNLETNKSKEATFISNTVPSTNDPNSSLSNKPIEPQCQNKIVPYESEEDQCLNDKEVEFPDPEENINANFRSLHVSHLNSLDYPGLPRSNLPPFSNSCVTTPAYAYEPPDISEESQILPLDLSGLKVQQTSVPLDLSQSKDNSDCAEKNDALPVKILTVESVTNSKVLDIITLSDDEIENTLEKCDDSCETNPGTQDIFSEPEIEIIGEDNFNNRGNMPSSQITAPVNRIDHKLGTSPGLTNYQFLRVNEDARTESAQNAVYKRNSTQQNIEEYTTINNVNLSGVTALEGDANLGPDIWNDLSKIDFNLTKSTGNSSSEGVESIETCKGVEDRNTFASRQQANQHDQAENNLPRMRRGESAIPQITDSFENEINEHDNVTDKFCNLRGHENANTFEKRPIFLPNSNMYQAANSVAGCASQSNCTAGPQFEKDMVTTWNELDRASAEKICDLSDSDEGSVLPLLELYRKEYKKYLDIKHTEQNVTNGLKLLENQQENKLFELRSCIKSIMQHDPCGRALIAQRKRELKTAAQSCGKKVAETNQERTVQAAVNNPIMSPLKNVSLTNTTATNFVPNHDNIIMPGSSTYSNTNYNQNYPPTYYNYSSAAAGYSSIPGQWPTATSLIKSCARCGQDASYNCKSCGKMYYCSVLCAKEDWDKGGHRCN